MIKLAFINQWTTEDFCFINVAVYRDWETGLEEKGLQFIFLGLGIDIAIVTYYA